MPGVHIHKRPVEKGGNAATVRRRKRIEHKPVHTTHVEQPHRGGGGHGPVHPPSHPTQTNTNHTHHKPVAKTRVKTVRKVSYTPRPEEHAGNSMSSDNYSVRRKVVTLSRKKVKIKQ